MKQLICILGALFCLVKLWGQAITVPGSAFPVINTPSNDWRFIGLTTNGDSGGASSLLRSNWTMTYGQLRTNIVNQAVAEAATTIGNAGNVLQLGALGGTNDDTVILNTLLAQGGQFYFPPTNFTTGVLHITNNTIITGYGAQINFLTNLTATTNLSFATNVGNVLIQGLVFNGGNSGDCYNVVRSTATGRVWSNPSINQNITFRDIRVFGYDRALIPSPIADTTLVMQLPRLRFDNTEFSTNSVGIYCATIDVNNAAEYLECQGLVIYNCSYGMWLQAGNIEVINCQLSHNYTAIQVDGGGGSLNPGHGLIIANTINHGAGNDIVCSNLLNFGEYIQDNVFAAGTASIEIDNCSAVVVSGNHFRGGGGVAVRTASAGTNYVYGNDYTGPWKNPGLTVFDFVCNAYAPTTNLVSWNNISVDTPGSDDPYKYNPYAMQSLFLTSTNMPPTNSYTPFGSFLWESNGVHTFKLRSDVNGAWTSTNVVN